MRSIQCNRLILWALYPIFCFISFAVTPLVAEVLFADDFADGLSAYAIVSQVGDRTWHLSGDDGIDGSPCVRFSNNYDPPYEAEDDWIVTQAIDCRGASRVTVRFSGWHIDNGPVAVLAYTDAFNGVPVASQWTTLAVPAWGDPWTWSLPLAVTIENPPSTLYLGFHYASTTSEAAYVLIDDWSVTSEEALILTEVGRSSHFRFLTDLAGYEHFSDSFATELDKSLERYASLWNRAGEAARIPESSFIDVILTERDRIPYLGANTPTWKCGAPGFSDDVLYLSPPLSAESQAFYGDIAGMAKMVLAQYALVRGLGRWDHLPREIYFFEAFGRYEAGWRPDPERVRAALNRLGTTTPDLSVVETMDVLADAEMRDLLMTYIECKVLRRSYFRMVPYGNVEDWHLFLRDHYVATGNARRKLLYASAHFDFYGSEAERTNLEALGQVFEDELLIDQSRYGVRVGHRFNVCLYQKAMMNEITGLDWITSRAIGGDLMEIVPLAPGSFDGLLKHEFMHLIVNLMSAHPPGQLLNEGIAVFAEAGSLPREEFPPHRYKVQEYFHYFQRKYGRDPTIDEFLDNTEGSVEDGHWLDVYFFGHFFWSYFFDQCGDYGAMADFIRGERDWTVFSGRSKTTEAGAFLQFLKEYGYTGPPREAVVLPFAEGFESSTPGWELEGWTRLQRGAPDLWDDQSQISGEGKTCAWISHPYWLDDKEVDSWLVSPPLDASAVADLVLEFRYWGQEHGPALELYWTDHFESSTVDANWRRIDGTNLNPTNGQWKSSGAIRFTPQAPTVYLAFRYVSHPGDAADFALDQVVVRGEGVALRPPVVKTELTSGGKVRLKVKAASALQRYQLEQCDELQNWSPVGSARAGDGNDLIFEVDPPSGGHTFYRVSTEKATE